jgi:hypothetical protein
MTSRRSFLLGIGALVSASFVTRVKAHVLEIARPLLLEPKRAEETLYLYEQSGWATTGSGGSRSGRTTFTSHRRPRPGGSTCGRLDTPSRRRMTTNAPFGRCHSNPRTSTSISMATISIIVCARAAC